MKWFTGYWGMEVMAETEDDVRILKELMSALPQKAEEGYEAGEVEDITHADLSYFSWGGWDTAINAAPFALRFVR